MKCCTLEEMALGIETVYVRLLDEGTEVFRPVHAEHVEKSSFRLLDDGEFDFTEEHLEFAPGTTVECEQRNTSEGMVKVAVRVSH